MRNVILAGLFVTGTGACSPTPSETTGAECRDPCASSTECLASCVCRTTHKSCPERCDVDAGDPRLAPEKPTEAHDELRAALRDAVNEARRRGGCCPSGECFSDLAELDPDTSLNRAAQQHAQDMTDRNYFDHVTPDGLTPFDRFLAAGFRGCALGENLASGYETPSAVIAAWLASKEHCRLLLGPNFTHQGVGVADGGPSVGLAWVQALGAKSNAMIR